MAKVLQTRQPLANDRSPACAVLLMWLEGPEVEKKNNHEVKGFPTSDTEMSPIRFSAGEFVRQTPFNDQKATTKDFCRQQWTINQWQSLSTGTIIITVIYEYICPVIADCESHA